MRCPRRLALVATLAGLFGASAATAGTLTAATWSQVIYGFPLDRTGAQLGITGTSTATSIAASLVYPAFSTLFFLPKTPNGIPVDRAVTITQGGPQALTANPSMGNATMGVPGNVLVRTAIHNSKGVNQSTFMAGTFILVSVPLNVGVAGQVTITNFQISGIRHTFTVDFYAWTPGTLSFAGLTSRGVALPSVAAMGSFNLTAQGGGTVTLVSPTKISIDCEFSQRRTASFVSLKMYFVPEPGCTDLLAHWSKALRGAKGKRAVREGFAAQLHRPVLAAG